MDGRPTWSTAPCQQDRGVERCGLLGSSSPATAPSPIHSICQPTPYHLPLPLSCLSLWRSAGRQPRTASWKLIRSSCLSITSALHEPTALLRIAHGSRMCFVLGPALWLSNPLAGLPHRHQHSPDSVAGGFPMLQLHYPFFPLVTFPFPFNFR